MGPSVAPLVSVGIPLWRSERFLPVITRNVDALGEGDIEIIVSDRHGEDDALERLRERYGSEARFRWSSARDYLHWTDHYNHLLRMSRGRYFMWMPHDDTFPEGYVRGLAAALAHDPKALLAFGALDAIDLAGAPIPGWAFTPPPFRAARSSGIGDAIRLLFWGAAIPFRGVFRREEILARRLLLRSRARAADAAWVFAVALAGGLRYVPEFRCEKRYYPESTSATSPSVGDIMHDGRLLRACLGQSDLGWRDRITASAGITGWQATRLVGRVVPASFRPSQSHVIRGLLPPALRPGQRRRPAGTR